MVPGRSLEVWGRWLFVFEKGLVEFDIKVKSAISFQFTFFYSVGE